MSSVKTESIDLIAWDCSGHLGIKFEKPNTREFNIHVLINGKQQPPLNITLGTGRMLMGFELELQRRNGDALEIHFYLDPDLGLRFASALETGMLMQGTIEGGDIWFIGAADILSISSIHGAEAQQMLGFHRTMAA